MKQKSRKLQSGRDTMLDTHYISIVKFQVSEKAIPKFAR